MGCSTYWSISSKYLTENSLQQVVFTAGTLSNWLQQAHCFNHYENAERTQDGKEIKMAMVENAMITNMNYSF